MSVTREDIIKVAKLSRLSVSDTDIPKVTESINEILQLIDNMQELNTESVEPLANPHDAVQILREDEVTASNEREALMQNAPEAEKGLFLVPKVIE